MKSKNAAQKNRSDANSKKVLEDILALGYSQEQVLGALLLEIQLLRPTQVAPQLGYSGRHFRRIVEELGIPRVRVGVNPDGSPSFRYPVADLIRWKNERLVS